MAFNNPGSNEPLLLATAGQDSVINVWELNTNRELRSFQAATRETSSGGSKSKPNSNRERGTFIDNDRSQSSDKGSGNSTNQHHVKFNVEPHENEIPAFNDKPLCQFKGHSSYIISLSCK